MREWVSHKAIGIETLRVVASVGVE